MKPWMNENFKFKCKKSQNQTNTLTPCHTRFEIEILRYDKNKRISFEYQCNTKYSQPDFDSCFYAYLMDAEAFMSCQDIDEFSREFGFEKVSECLRAYNGCKEAYINMLDFVGTENEIRQWLDYYSEIGY
ncbi:hypothetical protein AALA22_09075 [Anaerovoracaceae bacterium 41-7]